MFRNISWRMLAAAVLAVGGICGWSRTSLAEYEYMGPLKPVASPAELAVRKVIEQHIAGITKGDAQQISAAWDTNVGRITFVGRDKQGKEVVQSGPISDSIDLWAKTAKPAEGEILSIDIAGDKMAMVKARIKWNGQTFDDYLVLLATGDEWKLVSKTYSVVGGRGASGYGISCASR